MYRRNGRFLYKMVKFGGSNPTLALTSKQIRFTINIPNNVESKKLLHKRNTRHSIQLICSITESIKEPFLRTIKINFADSFQATTCCPKKLHCSRPSHERSKQKSTLNRKETPIPSRMVVVAKLNRFNETEDDSDFCHRFAGSDNRRWLPKT